MASAAVLSLRLVIEICPHARDRKTNEPKLSTPQCAILRNRATTRPGWETLLRAWASPRAPSFSTSRSKDGLFFEAYKKAVRSFSPYLNVPADVRERGFFGVLYYWLVRTEHMLREDWIPYRVYLLGQYGTDLSLRREINRFLIAEDPYGRVDFVRFGLERGELRRDLDIEMVVSILDWVVERFQDALLIEELDPGLFRHQGDSAERKEARITQFLDVLKRAIGTEQTA